MDPLRLLEKIDDRKRLFHGLDLSLRNGSVLTFHITSIFHRIDQNIRALNELKESKVAYWLPCCLLARNVLTDLIQFYCMSLLSKDDAELEAMICTEYFNAFIRTEKDLRKVDETALENYFWFANNDALWGLVNDKKLDHCKLSFTTSALMERVVEMKDKVRDIEMLELTNLITAFDVWKFFSKFEHLSLMTHWQMRLQEALIKNLDEMFCFCSLALDILPTYFEKQ